MDDTKSYLPIAMAVLRGLLQIASGVGFTWALTVTADQITMAATAAVMLGTMLWSAWQKIAAVRDARREVVDAAVASVARGVPVAVNVTPPGQPNEAVPIPGVEIAAAAHVGITTAELNRAEAARHGG